MTTSTLLTLFTTCILMISTTHAATSLTTLDTTNTNNNNNTNQLNASSCFPIVLRMTYCLDFLITGSLVPTPSDQCCIRLKVTTELELPCIWDFFKNGTGWGRYHIKLNDTRAGSLLQSCGIPFPFPPLQSSHFGGTSEVVQPALTPESLVPDNPSGQGMSIDPVEAEQVEVLGPSPSASTHKLPRLLLH